MTAMNQPTRRAFAARARVFRLVYGTATPSPEELAGAERRAAATLRAWTDEDAGIGAAPSAASRRATAVRRLFGRIEAGESLSDRDFAEAVWGDLEGDNEASQGGAGAVRGRVLALLANDTQQPGKAA